MTSDKATRYFTIALLFMLLLAPAFWLWIHLCDANESLSVSESDRHIWGKPEKCIEATLNLLYEICPWGTHRERKKSALITAIDNYDWIEIDRYLGKNLNYLDMATGFTPLAYAIDNPDLVKKLLEHGADPNYAVQVSRYKISPLYYACIEGLESGKHHDKIIEMLLEHGADANFGLSVDGVLESIPLIMECDAGNHETVKLLLAHGAKVNLQDMHGTTALMVACQNGRKDVVELLLAHGAGVNIADKKGAIAMYFASFSGNPEARFDIAKCLLRHGSILDFKVEEYGEDWDFIKFTQKHHPAIHSLLTLYQKNPEAALSMKLQLIPFEKAETETKDEVFKNPYK